jgi:hypothetical protein
MRRFGIGEVSNGEGSRVGRRCLRRWCRSPGLWSGWGWAAPGLRLIGSSSILLYLHHCIWVGSIKMDPSIAYNSSDVFIHKVGV